MHAFKVVDKKHRRSVTQNLFGWEHKPLIKNLLSMGVIYNVIGVQSQTFWVLNKG